MPRSSSRLLFVLTFLSPLAFMWTGFGVEPYLVKDINTLADTAGSNPAKFCALGSHVYFTAETSATGIELWKSDGTVDGTKLVRDIREGTSSSSPGGPRQSCAAMAAGSAVVGPL